MIRIAFKSGFFFVEHHFGRKIQNPVNRYFLLTSKAFLASEENDLSVDEVK